MIDKIKERIAEIEKAVQDLVSQHSVLIGHLSEAKHLLMIAEQVVEAVAPDSHAAVALEAVDNAVSMVEKVVEPS